MQNETICGPNSYEVKQSECNKDHFPGLVLINMHIDVVLAKVFLYSLMKCSCSFTVEVYRLRMLCVVPSLCDCCTYVKYCVFCVYDVVYTCVNTSISPVISVQFVYMFW